MAAALARGLHEPALVFDVQHDRAEKLAGQIGGEALESGQEVAERADVVVLAHKPKHLEDAAKGVAGTAKAVASIAAATPIARLEEVYPDIPVYRFIPNIPVEVGRGVLCYVPGTHASDGPEDDLLKILGRCGTVIRLDAYREATQGFEVLDIECFVVNDELQAAGTFDRLYRCPDGRVRVADLKTGKS